MDLLTIFWIVIVAGIVLAAFLIAFNISGSAPSPYVGRKLMTDHEKAFFPKLENAARRLGGYRVFPQVAMAAIVDTRDNLTQSARTGMRNTFDRKIMDFVIVDAKMNVVMIVELDDRTHRADRDARRDEITAGAGHATARFRSGYKITSEQIEVELRRIWNKQVRK